MKKNLFLLLVLGSFFCNAQTNPAITNWLINTTGAMGRHYLLGNTTPVNETTLANVQQVRYNSTYVYVNATGIPTYITGPYALGAVSVALNNNYRIRIPLNPVANTGNLTAVGNGAIAVFINGTVAFRARDAATYNNAGQWHQNAVYFENLGFDCAHGHPGPMTADYHVHQNPAAFTISAMPTSNVCDTYLADGLYVPDPTMHSPLLGFAPDGFPIYGAYGYSDPLNATSDLKRIESSYKLRNITSRTTLPNGTPAIGPSFTEMIISMLPNSTPLPAVLGAYEEDYEFLSGSGDLDVHNGRFCVTPEYPNGIYCYFTTLDELNNPAYPYIIGDSYYGVVAGGGMGPGGSFTNVTIPTDVTVYTPVSAIHDIAEEKTNMLVYTSSDKETLVVQATDFKSYDRVVQLINLSGQVIQTSVLYQGSTMCSFDLRTVYSGIYFVSVFSGKNVTTKKVLVHNN